MLYTGRRLTGVEAVAIGLCDRVVSIDEVWRESHAMAADIAGSSPLALRAIRRTLRGGLVDEVKRSTDIEHANQQVLRRTGDYREGVAAMADRRPPTFLGR